MKVSINGTTYENASWSENTLSMETNMSLAEIEAAFIPGLNVDIIVTEGEEEIARYYNKGLTSIKVEGNDPRRVDAVFDVTQINENAETEIRESLEDSDGAIMDLAEIVSDLSNIDVDGINNELQSHQETINTWFSSASDINQFITQLRMEDGILDHMDARITRLEQIVASIAPAVQVVETNNESEGE